MTDLPDRIAETPDETHAHTFVSYPAPSGPMLDTGEMVWVCVHPGCMLVRWVSERTEVEP